MQVPLPKAASVLHLSYFYFPDDGKDGRQEEKGMTEDEMVGWHHRLNGYEFGQAPGADEGKPGMLQSMGSQRVTYY